MAQYTKKWRKTTYRTAANRVRNCNSKDTARSGSVVLFPGEVQNIRTSLEEKNREIKKQLEKRREKKSKKFTERPDYRYYTPKTEKGDHQNK